MCGHSPGATREALYIRSVIKNPPTKAGHEASIPGLGRPPGEGNVNPIQYSCLGNPKDRGAWQATVHGVTKKLKYDLPTKQKNNICIYKHTHTRHLLLYPFIC